MDRNDQQAINGLFSKLAHVEQQSGQRDAESDRFIQERISQQPGAPYYMAQTIVVQEQALEAAQRRIEELEYQNTQSAQQRGGGGFFSSMFGSNAQPQQQRPAPSEQLTDIPLQRLRRGAIRARVNKACRCSNSAAEAFSPVPLKPRWASRVAYCWAMQSWA